MQHPPLNQPIRKALEYFEKFTIEYQQAHPTAQVVFPDRILQRQCIAFVKAHLQDHIQEYKVHQVEIDLFKLFAWMGMFFFLESKKLKKNFPPIIPITILNYLLVQDTRKLPADMIQKISAMALNNECPHNNKLSVGQNGIYLIFRSCSKLTLLSNP